MRDSFFPDAVTLTRQAAPRVPAGAMEAARAFVARLLRPAPKVQASGVITLMMAAESAQHKRAIVRQVVRWHNRHPLARRIGAADINGFGSAALPFSAPQADGQRFALFDDAGLLPGLCTARLTAFARQHGHSAAPGARHWARREVNVAPGWSPAHAQHLHLQVAAIKSGGRTVRRVLLGQPAQPGAAWPVLGQRIWSRPRVALASALASLPLLAAAWLAVPLLTPLLQRAPAEGLVAVSPLTAVPALAEVAQRRAPSPAAARTTPAPQAPLPTPTEAPVPAPSPLGLPIEHATDPLRMAGGGTPTGRSGPALKLALIGAIGADPAEQMAFQANLRSALPQMGNHTARLSIDLIGTPDGDAVTLWPFDDEASAQRVGQALRAQGLIMRIAEL